MMTARELEVLVRLAFFIVLKPHSFLLQAVVGKRKLLLILGGRSFLGLELLGKIGEHHTIEY